MFKILDFHLPMCVMVLVSYFPVVFLFIPVPVLLPASVFWLDVSLLHSVSFMCLVALHPGFSLARTTLLMETFVFFY